MIDYLNDHWQGRQHVAWSLVANVLWGFGAIFATYGTALLLLPEWLDVKFVLFVAFVATFLAWLVWSVVGTTRSAIRSLRDPTTRLPTKAFSVLALLVLVAGLSTLTWKGVDEALFARRVVQAIKSHGCMGDVNAVCKQQTPEAQR